MNPHAFAINPKLDLVLEREIDVPPALVWAAWTEPKHLLKWFTPAPWSTVACEVDLRTGGKIAFTMRSPEGQDFPYEGCYLELVRNEKLVWTSAMTAGFRPQIVPAEAFHFTAFVHMQPNGKGTKYTVVAVHSDEIGKKKHEEMGFHDGWGKALDQLVALMKNVQ